MHALFCLTPDLGLLQHCHNQHAGATASPAPTTQVYGVGWCFNVTAELNHPQNTTNYSTDSTHPGTVESVHRSLAQTQATMIKAVFIIMLMALGVAITHGARPAAYSAKVITTTVSWPRFRRCPMRNSCLNDLSDLELCNG